jgi:small multidrug resistance family-3 protein
VGRAKSREDLPEGLRLRFAPTAETVATIARAVEAERHCCRFLRFGITVEPDGGPVFLELTGPVGTREFLGALRGVTTNVAIFAVAAFFEIAGCFAFWMWLRRGGTPLVVLLGIASLICFAVALTRIDSAFAGRAYAAYGGIHIAASLVWLWAAERQRPTVTDLVGASLAVIGALIIIGFASRTN